MSVNKRYFSTHSLKNKFPWEFIISKNPRYIVVQQCKALYNDFLVGDIEMHASFIERDFDLDHYCINTNEIRTKYKKYYYNSTKQDFEIWFTDMNENPVEVKCFTLELLLIF